MKHKFKLGDQVICNKDTDNVELDVVSLLKDGGVMVSPCWGNEDPYPISEKYLDLVNRVPMAATTMTLTRATERVTELEAQVKAATDMIAIQKALIDKMGTDMATKDKVIKLGVYFFDAEDYEPMDEWCEAYTKGNKEKMANIDLYIKHFRRGDFTDKEWEAEKQDMIQDMTDED